MNESLLIAILSPVLLTTGGLITWFFKSRKEALQLIEERSREKRMETYKEIMDPFIVLITPKAKQIEQDKALITIVSVKYKRVAFDLITFGSDATVKCYNSMMQYVYVEGPQDNIKLLSLFAEFILNIRKDLYNKKTKLKRSETLEFIIKDIEIYRQEIDKK